MSNPAVKFKYLIGRFKKNPQLVIEIYIYFENIIIKNRYMYMYTCTHMCPHIYNNMYTR